MYAKEVPLVYRLLQRHVRAWNVPVIDLVEIQTKDPFKVLVATILSARTKDSLTITKLPQLWEHVRTLEDLKRISSSHLEKLIYPIGFYRTKVKHLKLLPEVIEDEFDGKIPRTVEELCRLPGVGRKTANLVVSVAFKKPAICVDVHVHRIMNRLGYIRTKDPLETEMTLRKKLPKKYWRQTNFLFVAFGQNLCTPVSPRCSCCPVKKYCKRVGVKKNR